MGHQIYTWSKEWTPALVASIEQLGYAVRPDTDASGRPFDGTMEAFVIQTAKQSVALVVYKTAPHMPIECENFIGLYPNSASLQLCDLIETLLLASGAKASRRPIASQRLYRSPVPDWSHVAGALARSSLSLQWLEALPTGLRFGTIKSAQSASRAKNVRICAGPMIDPVDSTEKWFVALRYRQGLFSVKSRAREKIIADVDSVLRQAGMSFIDTSQANRSH